MQNDNQQGRDGIVCKKTSAGMECYCLPMPAFGEKMAAVVVGAGSNFLSCEDEKGEALEFPRGTAHFIEHRLFRQKWGDAFSAFSKQGASANAFTDGEKTVYYFTCQTNFMENLRLLLSFVQNPYFLKEETAEEQRIIASEITMYEDDPSWRVYYQMLQGMYHTHPVRNPIAGTLKSIEDIDHKVLQEAYDALYTPDRFSLVCGGDIPVRKVFLAAEMVKGGKAGKEPMIGVEPEEIFESYKETKLGLSQPVFQIGFKMKPVKENLLGKRILMGFVLELLAGESSEFYEEAYEKELLEEPLGSAFFTGKGYGFCAFSGTGERGMEVGELLRGHLEKLQEKGIDGVDFERIRKKQIGHFLRRSQSVSAMVFGQIEWALADATPEEVFRFIKTVSKEDGEKLLQNELSTSKMVLSVIH